MTVTLTTLGVIEKAAEHLDTFHPGWYQVVDPKRLRLLDSERCVGGQIAQSLGITSTHSHYVDGRWVDGQYAWRIAMQETIDKLNEEFPDAGLFEDWWGICSMGSFEPAWRIEIRKRLNQDDLDLLATPA